jgi:DNA-binding transcriptional ArsR family regulator
MHDAALIETLKALAHPVRWRILAALATAEERNVGEIEQVTRIGQPALSQQLGVLRKSGLVVIRKDGKRVFYALAGAEVARVAEALRALAPASGPRQAMPSPASSCPASGVANFARLS